MREEGGREEGEGERREREERDERMLSDVLFPQVELEKYDRGVRWLREVLFNVKFTKERLLVVATKMINDVARYGIVEGEGEERRGEERGGGGEGEGWRGGVKGFEGGRMKEGGASCGGGVRKVGEKGVEERGQKTVQWCYNGTQF